MLDTWERMITQDVIERVEREGVAERWRSVCCGTEAR
jgi:hypothetical protein